MAPLAHWVNSKKSCPKDKKINGFPTLIPHDLWASVVIIPTVINVTKAAKH